MHGHKIEELNLKFLKADNLRLHFMTVKTTFLICTALFLSGIAPLSAVSRFGVTEQDRTMIRKMYDNVEMMRHEMGNHETELRVFENKLQNMEDAVEELRRLFDDTINGHKSKDALETKIVGQESVLKKLQTHANQSLTTLEGYHAKIAALQNNVEARNKDLDNLKTAVKSLINAIGAGDEMPEAGTVYEVRPGDSLGVIAQKKNISVREIKALNGLKNDTIFVGQKLKMPD